ncbi:hypothetical protein [Enterobacter sp. CC120223-11]|uniref:hypothetical protein n=1 Tax=Enterobacter sp. CC120223-11 TaxID=1378073 RepID=UPI000BC4E35F|nr:hypothetical protein [Enterobacter sp. CC120223-11]SNY66410.1 hypothetical protein SAMN02744775_01517 [Enterobacter sp. CC120223-11]
MELKRKPLALLVLPLIFSAYSAHANIDHMYINGPSYIERDNWSAEYSLENKEDYRGAVHWLLAENRFYRTHYFKSYGDTAITGFSMGWLPHTSLVQAAVQDNGEYRTLSRKFCQEGFVLGCTPLKSKTNYNKGEIVKVDLNFMPEGENKKDQLETEWTFDPATESLLKGVQISKDKFSLSFTAPELQRSSKVTIFNRVKTPTNEVLLKRDICLRGADQGFCMDMDNAFNVTPKVTSYDFSGFTENVGKFEKADRVFNKGTIFTCVEEVKCNNPDFTPVNGSSKWRAAWVETYF